LGSRRRRWREEGRKGGRKRLKRSRSLDDLMTLQGKIKMELHEIGQVGEKARRYMQGLWSMTLVSRRHLSENTSVDEKDGSVGVLLPLGGHVEDGSSHLLGRTSSRTHRVRDRDSGDYDGGVNKVSRRGGARVRIYVWAEEQSTKRQSERTVILAKMRLVLPVRPRSGQLGREETGSDGVADDLGDGREMGREHLGELDRGCLGHGVKHAGHSLSTWEMEKKGRLVRAIPVVRHSRDGR
jgi:hypothetical protein